MNKNNKKGKNIPTNLIPIGNGNKARNALPLQTQQIKKAKLDDLNPKTFIASIEQSYKQDTGNCENVLNNFMLSLKNALIYSNKPPKTYLSQCLALLCVSKKYSTLFTKSSVVDSMVSILCYNGKELTNTSALSSSYKPQTSIINPSSASKIKPLHIAICNIVVSCFKDVKTWPIQLVKAYLDDSFSDRVWVDLPECFIFVQNIETAFLTSAVDPRITFPLAAFSESVVDIVGGSDGSTSASTEGQEHSDQKVCSLFNKMITGLAGSDEFIRPRFDQCQQQVDALIAGWIKEIVDRRYMADTQSRPIIRTFCTLAGVPEIRSAAVLKSDHWLSAGKLQSITLTMLNNMAQSCSHNVLQNPNDVNFCIYLMFRFKYKVSKPHVQSALLECLRKVAELNAMNLKNILEMYINNEIYGTPTITPGSNVSTVASGNLIQLGSSSQNKSGPASVTFPTIFFRFPVESVEVLGELIHEQMCLLHSDIKPIKMFLRHICGWIKAAHPNPNSIYTAQINNGMLPNSLELQDLTKALLKDRSNNELMKARMSSDAGNFKETYLDNMIAIVCELQMLSVIRPGVKESFRDRSQDQDKRADQEALKSHYNTLLQIRIFTCKWLKKIYRSVQTIVSPEKMTNYIRQALFLKMVRHNDFSYAVDESYKLVDVWSNEPDKMLLVRGMTEVPLSDKLVQNLINLGTEKHLCFRPTEMVDMVSELMIRAAASASVDIVPLNLSKAEIIIKNMFACCTYELGQDDNDEKLQFARTFAYKSSFWKVCQALVVLASFCTNTCGSYLWTNFPSIRNLMQIVITDNFDEQLNDRDATEVQKICELESQLLESSGTSAGKPVIDASNSKLIHLLLFNLPQGPVRQPPPDVIDALRGMRSVLKIGDRLSQCRHPDFLFEIVREQDQSKMSSRKWIVDLVRKSSDRNIDRLPLLCLTEFIYHDLCQKVTAVDSNRHPSQQQPLILIGDSSRDGPLIQLVHKIRLVLSAQPSTDGRQDKDNLKNTVGALSNSFFNRLSDSSSFVRRVARECLYILLQPPNSNINLMDSSAHFVDTLKSIMNLNILQDNALICSVAETLRETLKFETDIDVLYSYINLFALMSSGNHKEWLANTVEMLSQLMLNRPIIADKLRDRDYQLVHHGANRSPSSSVSLISDLLAEIYLAHIHYTAFQAQVVPLEHRDEAVMVHMGDKQFPVLVKVIQSQLALVCWGVSRSPPVQNLIEFWFSQTPQLPDFVTIDHQPNDATEGGPMAPLIIPDWLVDAAVHSNIVPVMMGMLRHHVAINRSVRHSLTPAVAFMSMDFIRQYLTLMDSFIVNDCDLIDHWLNEVANEDNDNNRLRAMLATVTRMCTKVSYSDSRFQSYLATRHCSKSKSTNDKSALIVSAPTNIVKRIDRSTVAPTMTEPTDPHDAWNDLIQSNCSVDAINRVIQNLLMMSAPDRAVLVDQLIKLLQDRAGDYRIMPLLKLAQNRYDKTRSVPDHIEDEVHQLRQSHAVSGPNIIKSLVKSIMQPPTNDIGHRIDQLTLVGLGNGTMSDQHIELIHKLLFSSTHTLNQYSDYFMGDVLHQSHLASLRTILHSVLARRSTALLDASRVLDFITACLHQPRLQFSMQLPRSNRHIWPQQNAAIELSPSELVTLLGLVLAETDHLMEQHGPGAPCLVQSLDKRCQLIDIVSSGLGLVPGGAAGIINSWLNDCRTHSASVIDQLRLALYNRLPGLIDNSVTMMVGTVVKNGQDITHEEAAPVSSVQQIGQRLLSGLISSRTDIQDLAQQASKALVCQHPHLCIQLLPFMGALSDEALDGTDCWTEFRKKRGLTLYSNLLHLLDVMVTAAAATTDGLHRIVSDASMGKLVLNFIRVLIRYRDQHAFFSSFVAKFIAFLDKIVSSDDTDVDSDRHNFIIVEYGSEFEILSRIYPQFRNIVVLARNCGYGNEKTLPPLSVEENRSTSQLPLLKLDYLIDFRQKLSQTQSGNGVLVLIKDIDDISKRDPNFTGLFLDDLRALLNHSMNDVRLSVVHIINRYLNAFPHLAARIIDQCLTPSLMQSSCYWSRPFANLGLKFLLQSSMLAPKIVPNLLANHARLLISGNNGRGTFRESIELLENIIDNVSLETFMDTDDVSYSARPVYKKENVSTAGQRRHITDIDGDGPKAKRTRFK